MATKYFGMDRRDLGLSLGPSREEQKELATGIKNGIAGCEELMPWLSTKMRSLLRVEFITELHKRRERDPNSALN
jgi:hypothetical protein